MRLSAESFWSEFSKNVFPPLRCDVSTDVAIIGGGIAGLHTAYVLQNSGFSVCVIEKNTIGSGTTLSTTAKITSQHGLKYSDLVRRFGIDKARLYGKINQKAIQQISSLIETEHIDCDWRKADNYVFTTVPSTVSTLQDESNAARMIGLPASFTTTTELPFPIKGAVRFTEQATCNIGKYLAGLAKVIIRNGGLIYEHTNIKNIRDGKTVRLIAQGGKIDARYAICATKIPPAPLIARLGYAFYEHPHTSYVVAGYTKTPINNMYISPDDQHYSILPYIHNNRHLLLVGGEPHTPGLRSSEKRYNKLIDYTQKHLDVTDILYKWKAMDYLPYDGIPLVGKVYPWSKNLYCITGFQKWGLTSSMVAAGIISNLLHSKHNEVTRLFRTNRLSSVLAIPRSLTHI